jgi:RNA polymerase primary sigma factor
MRGKSTLNNSKNSEETILESYLQEISSATPLTDEEEARLAELIRKGDANAKNKLVKSNLKFVVSIARQYANGSVSILDLINEGNIALIKAAENFDPAFGKRFSSYAAGHLRRAMEAFLPQQEPKFVHPKTENAAGQSTDADFEAISKSDNEGLSALIGLLPERERNVLKDYYGISTTQLTLADIGMKYDITRERARQIRDTALRHVHRLKRKNELK